MALNFSHRPIFLEGVSECHGDRFCNPLLSDGDMKDCFDYGRDRSKSGGCSQELISNDILDLLPSDPFGMEISTTFTAITGWLEDLEMDYGGYGSELVVNNAEDYQLFAGLNLLWNNALAFQAFPGSLGFDCNTRMPTGVGGFYGTKAAPVVGFGPESGTYGCLDSNGKGSMLANLCFGSSSRLGEFSSFMTSPDEREISVMFDSSSGFGQHSPVKESRSPASSYLSTEEFDCCAQEIEVGSLFSGDSFEATCKKIDCCAQEIEVGSLFSGDSFEATCKMNGCWSSETIITADGSSDWDGVPHMALSFALNYLAVQDLLSMESVCKSLRCIVQTDALLWRRIHIGQPLNEKITDDVLLQLTRRAQGSLKCLSLIECPRITDEVLKQVVQNNPRLTKLSVPGCTRLSINGILDILKTLKSMGTMVKHLRVGGLYGVTMEQFEELKTLMCLDINQQQNAYKPHFFQREKYLSFEDDDDRNIDIEVCPTCLNLRLVYDCPTEVCRGKEGGGAQSCRACTICIPRCFQCGRCINDGEYEENFCLEVLCPDCSLQHHLKCKEMLDDFVPSITELPGIVESSG